VALYEVSLLGGFAVRVDDHPVPDRAWRHSRAAQLVKVLALADGHRLLRDQVCELLWPHLGPEAASANVRKAVYYARRALGSPSGIVNRGALLELSPEGLVIDAEVFESTARRALTNGSGLQTAAAGYAGDLLPEDLYAQWSEGPRARLRELHLDLLKAAGQWRQVLAIVPADETAHRGLMQEALDSGDRAAAVRQFELLRRQLRADLGVGPDRASVLLYEKALALRTDVPPSPGEIAQSLLARALIHLNSGELDDAARTAARARAMAIQNHLGREAGEASAILGILANMRGEWRDVFRSEFQDAVQYDVRLASFVLDAHTCLAEFTLVGPDGHEQLAGLAGELTSCARRSRSMQGEAIGTLILGEIALFSGSLDDARRRLGSAIRLFAEAEASSGQVLATLRLAELELAEGHRSAATRLLRRMLPQARESWLAPHLLVRAHGLLIEAGTGSTAALRRIRAADDDLRATRVCPPCSLGFHLAAAKALARAGVVDQSGRRLVEAERLAGMWPAGAAHASLWEARAVLHEAHGDLERARVFFREAADRFDQVGRNQDRDRCQRGLGPAAP